MKNLLPPLYLDAISGRIEQLEEIIKNLERNPLPDHKEKLRISISHGKTQFYLLSNSKDTKGKYIPKSEIARIKEIAQSSYNKTLLRTARKELRTLKAFYKSQLRNTSTICNRYSLQRLKLLDLATTPDKLYAEKWLSTIYKQKPFTPGTPELLTSKGLRVRSKSEIIIAETLDRLGIPFHYEYPIRIKGATFHPDFYCLNLRTRQEIVWEHFGIMDAPEYAAQMIEKVALYHKQGYFTGENFIFTLESGEHPLTSAEAARTARHYLK